MKRRVLCLLLALATACSLYIGAFATGDSDESDAQKAAKAEAEAKLVALQQESAKHQKKLEELKAKVAEAKKNTQDAMNTKVLLDRQNDEIGKSGLEVVLEKYLKGTDGKRKVEMDSSGRIISAKNIKCRWSSRFPSCRSFMKRGI